jgi:hypothetical protein
VGWKSQLSRQQQPRPERVLRLRLERAYVIHFTPQGSPGSETVLLSVDKESGLPISLFEAISLKGRFHQDIPGIADLPLSERIRRQTLIGL